jgi:hypothetical protein
MARLASAILGVLGLIALIVTITLYGNWRSSQTSVGLLTNTTPAVDLVTRMVIAGLVAVAFLGTSFLFWTWQRPDKRPHAGWYADPTMPGQERWWDGEGWTTAVLDHPT